MLSKFSKNKIHETQTGRTVEGAAGANPAIHRTTEIVPHSGRGRVVRQIEQRFLSSLAVKREQLLCRADRSSDDHVRDIDEKTKTGICTTCGQRVSVHRNKNRVWTPVSHSFESAPGRSIQTRTARL